MDAERAQWRQVQEAAKHHQEFQRMLSKTTPNPANPVLCSSSVLNLNVAHASTNLSGPIPPGTFYAVPPTYQPIHYLPPQPYPLPSTAGAYYNLPRNYVAYDPQQFASALPFSGVLLFLDRLQHPSTHPPNRSPNILFESFVTNNPWR